MTDFFCNPGGSVSGVIRVPGDKSISHRSIILSSIADGTSSINGFLEGEDSLNTLKAFQSMGVPIARHGNRIQVEGVGINGLKKPGHRLDMGNSGTAMRLLMGLLAGQPFDSELIGDSSLSARPMNRVIDPLKSMGAVIESNRGTAPIKIRGQNHLTAIEYNLPVASAQVKSCLLLAGIYAEGETVVREPAPTRDHSERMLRGFGCDVLTNGNEIRIRGGQRLKATNIDVPADISSAAFFLVAASIAENSELTLKHVGINPTRTGIIEILRRMGADIEVTNPREIGGEPVADIVVRSARLKGIDIPQNLVPLAIDEFPVIFIAPACAVGTTRLTGAAELRVKESDRIQSMADGLAVLGVDATPLDDGIVINGGQVGQGEVDSHGDHRIAMAFSVASLRANGQIKIRNCDNVNTSFPGYIELAASTGIRISIDE